MVAAVGCRQILGIDDKELASVGDSGTATSKVTVCGGFSQVTVACADCLDSECCEAFQSCESDPTCAPTYGCVQRCAGDADCVAWCTGSYARPPTLAAVIACSTDECGSECGTECGDLTNASTSCDTCVRDSCCSENDACSKNVGCVEFDFCLKRCLPSGSERCEAECREEFPDGLDDYAALESCIGSACSNECAPERNWSCLDEPRAPLKPPSLDDLELEMTVIEYLTGVPYAALVVKACDPDDFTCERPRATATTDDDGNFAMAVPTPTSGFDGYLDFSIESDAPSDLYPALYYFRPPLIVGGWRGRLRLPSRQSIEVLVSAMEVAIDPVRGHMALVPWDCTLAPAAGVSLSADRVDEKSTQYYFSGSAPSTALTQTAGEPSIGGFLNLRPGVVRITATVASREQLSAEMNFVVRPGTLTTGAVPPLQ